MPDERHEFDLSPLTLHSGTIFCPYCQSEISLSYDAEQENGLEEALRLHMRAPLHHEHHMTIMRDDGSCDVCGPYLFDTMHFLRHEFYERHTR